MVTNDLIIPLLCRSFPDSQLIKLVFQARWTSSQGRDLARGARPPMEELLVDRGNLHVVI